MKNQLVWLRNDLRVSDNPALNSACLTGPTTCIFLIDAAQWQQHDMSPWRIALTLRSIDCVSQQLGQLGIKLIIRRCDSFAEAPKLVVECAQELKATHVSFNAEIALNEERRDGAAVHGRGGGVEAGETEQCHRTRGGDVDDEAGLVARGTETLVPSDFQRRARQVEVTVVGEAGGEDAGAVRAR